MRTAVPSLVLALAVTPVAIAADEAIPENSRQVLTGHGWQVVVHEEVVPGTERLRAPRFRCTHYLAKLGAVKGRIVCEDPGGRGPWFRPLRIDPDGTVLGEVGEGKLLAVGPDDAAGKPEDGTAVPLPDEQAKSRTVLLHATAAGLVAYQRPLSFAGGRAGVYFVPLDGRKPVPEKAVELCQRNLADLSPTRSGFLVSDRWIVWPGGSYEVGTGKARERAAEAGQTTLLAVDGDLLVTQLDSTKANAAFHEVAATDLKTGKVVGRRAGTSETRFAAVHDGVAYTLERVTTKPGERGPRLEVAAFDLTKPNATLLRKVLVQKVNTDAAVVLTAKGFTVPGAEDGEVEWVARPK